MSEEDKYIDTMEEAIDIANKGRYKSNNAGSRMLLLGIKCCMKVVAWSRSKYSSLGDVWLINLIITNVLTSHQKDLKVAYTRSKSHSKIKVGRRVTSVHKICKAVDLLVLDGWLIECRGRGSPNKAERIISTLQPSEQLLNYFPRGYSEKLEKLYLDQWVCAIIRGEDKLAISYKEGSDEWIKLKEVKEEMKTINQVNSECDVRLDGERVDTYLTRIFNYDLNHGGRFYRNSVVGMSADDRLKLTMDGEPVFEIDYSGLHFRIVGALVGIESWQIHYDPYVAILDKMFPDGNYSDSDRSMAKVAVNILFNSSSRSVAAAAVRGKMEDYSNRVKDGGKELRIKSAEELLKTIRTLYPEISAIMDEQGRFGLKLQNIDSEIAKCVMLTFIQAGVPILPVHDSFIIQAKYSEELASVMGQCFNEHFERDNLIVPLKVNYMKGGEKCSYKIIYNNGKLESGECE